MDVHSLYLIVQSKWIASKPVQPSINTFKLSQAALQCIEVEGPDKFEVHYGSHFIAGYFKGGEFCGVVSVKTSRWVLVVVVSQCVSPN